MGVRMHLSKIGPVVALGLSGVGLCLLALAPLGWRVGWWPYGFGLYWMMPVSGLVAADAVILSVLTLTRWWPHLRLRGLVMLFVALALGAACQIASNSDPFRFQFRPPTERVDLST